MNIPVPGNLISVAAIQDGDVLPLLNQNGYVTAKNLRTYAQTGGTTWQAPLLFASVTGTLASVVSAPVSHTFPAGTFVSFTASLTCLADDAATGYVAGDVLPLILAVDYSNTTPALGTVYHPATRVGRIFLAGLAGSLDTLNLPKTDGSGFATVTASDHFGFSLDLVYF